MLSMQGQDFGGVKHALALRCGPDGPDESQVGDAFAEGTVVRNRPSRGTLQVTAPEDLAWLTGLMAPRSNAAGMKRREDLGVTQAMVDGIEGEIRAALTGGKVRSRTDLRNRFAEAGLPDDSARVSHIMRHLTEVEIDRALAEPLLLPSFDEYLLGYTERGAVLDPQHFAQIVPGRNGVFRAIVVTNGEVVGTWQKSMTKSKVNIEIKASGRLSAATKAGLSRRTEEVGAFLGRMAGCSYGT